MLSSELEFCLNEAFQSARERRHEFMTVEHLLLALLDIPKVHEILKACNSNVGQLRRQLTEFIDEATPLMPLDEEGEVQPTLGFQRVLQRAVFHVQSSGKKEVTGSNVLVAIFSEKQSQAVYFLGLQDVTRLDVVNYISHGMPQLPGEPAEDEQDISLDQEAETDSTALEKYATNLNQLPASARRHWRKVLRG
jgi:ATP-dependent Clp protease ATP-binding subunit ClpA